MKAALKATPYRGHGHVIVLEHEGDGRRVRCECGYETPRQLPSVAMQRILRHRESAFRRSLR